MPLADINFFLLREPARFLESVTDFCHPCDADTPDRVRGP